MKRGALLTILVFASYIFYVLGWNALLLFFTSFAFLGTGKIIRKRLSEESDLSDYSFWNFAYSAGPPMIAASLSLFLRDENFWMLIATCGLASVVSDTLSSDIGQAVSGKTINIVNFRTVPSGTDGGISIVGTIVGIIASVMFIYISSLIFSDFKNRQLIWIAVLAFIGNLLDSVFGATLQKKGIINNEQVNAISITAMMFFATLIVN